MKIDNIKNYQPEEDHYEIERDFEDDVEIWPREEAKSVEPVQPHKPSVEEIEEGLVQYMTKYEDVTHNNMDIFIQDTWEHAIQWYKNKTS